VTVVDALADHALQCGLLADTACIRVQLRGAWTAQTRDGFARWAALRWSLAPTPGAWPWA
jgi:hypothetical protein